MKLLPYSQLPLFYEITEVIRKNQIQSWQANDFWKKIKLEFDVDTSNANYQNVYRFIHRLVRGGFLEIDCKKNEMGCSTYSESLKMHEFREQFCQYDNESFLKVEKHYQTLENNIQHLKDEIDAINDLKIELPEFSFEFNHLHTAKIEELTKLKSRLIVLTQLINSMSNEKNQHLGQNIQLE
ncbi:hypothetical protein ACT4VH_08160 [Acinetobacter baumannii]